MSLIHVNSAMKRGAALAMIAASPLLAVSPFQTQQAGSAAPVVARPGARVGGVVARCAGCSDSVRLSHEVLMIRLDSLRNEYMYRRLSPAEMEAVGRAMEATMASLRSFVESSARARTAPGAPGFAGATVTAAPAAAASHPGAYTVTVQTGAKRGYLGVTFDGPMYGYPPPPDQPDVIRFLQYPMIASMDPASPAERGGLAIGDTLLALNGTDVVENQITLSKVLVPDEKVVLKVRRSGDAKEFRIVVAEAPPFVARRAVPPLPPQREVAVAAPAPAPAPGRVQARSLFPSQPAEAPSAFRFQGSGRVFVFTAAIAGARIETITDGLDKLAGVKEGVLVMQVPPGTPAYTSGLRVGDIILTVNGASVTTTRQLTNYVNNVDRDDGVRLGLLRDKKQQELTLRW